MLGDKTHNWNKEGSLDYLRDSESATNDVRIPGRKRYLLELGSRFRTRRRGCVFARPWYQYDERTNEPGRSRNSECLYRRIAFVTSDLSKAVAQARNDNVSGYLVEYTQLTRDSPDHHHTVRMF